MALVNEHEKILWLARRAAFGFAPGELEQFEPKGAAAYLDRLVDPDANGVAARGRSLRRHRRSDRPAGQQDPRRDAPEVHLLVDRSHGGDAAATRRDDDVVLARSLRGAIVGGAIRPADGRPHQPSAHACARKLPHDDPRGHHQRRDVDLSRRRQEHQSCAERELRARAARALHDGHRQLHRSRRSSAAVALTGWQVLLRQVRVRPSTHVCTTRARRRCSASRSTMSIRW